MDSNILVSIVVPVYNTSKYLDQCLQSLVNQTLKEIEIICVNDASTDNSLEILNEWATRDSRITVINFEKNRRQGAARNVAIQQARGKYIGLIDSDDYIYEDMYRSLVANSDGFTADIVVANLNAKHKDSDELECNFKDRPKTQDDLIRSVLVNGCRMVTNILKKKLFVEYDLWYPEGLLYEDNANMAPLFMVAQKVNIFYNECPYYFYRINNTSTMRSLDNIHCWDRLITADMFLDHTRRLNKYENFKDEIDYAYYSLVIIYSFRFAMFSFSRYQYKKVKEIIAKYKAEVGFDVIKKNKYYIEDNNRLRKIITELIRRFPLIGYVIWAYSHLKRKLK